MNHHSIDTGETMVGGTAEVNPRVYLRALWRRKWIFLAILVVIPVGVYLVVSREQKVYQSSALIEVQPVAVDPASAAAAQSSTQSVNAVAALITTTPVANQAAKRLPRPHPSGRSLLPDVTATADTNTGFITVTANASSPRRAAAIANAFASGVAVTRARQAIRSLNSAIFEATQELNSLPTTDRTARTQLAQRIQQDQALRLAQGSNAQILQSAVPVAAPVSPHVGTALVLGFIAALLLGFVVVALAELADRRLRSLEDLEALTGGPAIGVIPATAFSGKGQTPAEHEAFHTLRAALRYFNVDRPRRSIVVTSAAKGEGKTTVAIQLAVACAEAGDDVILVDADLRHPQVAARLDIQKGAGLGAVVAGLAALEEALVQCHLSPTQGEGRLGVLASADVPPNPAQLLGSQRMHDLMDELSTIATTVIIDTSPALVVADAYPLFREASGTVLVARIDKSLKTAIRRLSWTIQNAGGSVLGAVATGAESRDPYGRYNYVYGARTSEVVSDNGVPDVVEVDAPGRFGRLLRRNGRASEAESEPSRAG